MNKYKRQSTNLNEYDLNKPTIHDLRKIKDKELIQKIMYRNITLNDLVKRGIAPKSILKDDLALIDEYIRRFGKYSFDQLCKKQYIAIK